MWGHSTHIQRPCMWFFLITKIIMKKKVYAYIDWFNLYHALQKKIQQPGSSRSKEYQRADMRKLLTPFLEEDESLHMVYFFTAYTSRSSDAKKRHKALVAWLRKTWTDVILGRFSKVQRSYVSKWNNVISLTYDSADQKMCHASCKVKKLTYRTFEEKETDVNMALKILEDWLLEKYDTAFIVSWDSDIVPPIKRINALAKKWTIQKKIFKNIVVPGTKWKTMQRACDSYHIIPAKHFQNALLPDHIQTDPSTIIHKPQLRD